MDNVNLGIEERGALDTENASQSSSVTSFDNITLFLSTRKYPDGLNLNQKRTLRKAAVNFCTDEGKLYYVGKNKSEKRLVIQDDDRKKEILQQCHVLNASTHCGQKKTLEKLESLFFWRGMVNDVVTCIQSCDFCRGKEDRRQSSNKKLRRMASGSEISPSPINSEVPENDVLSGAQQEFPTNNLSTQTYSLRHHLELIEQYEQEIYSMSEKAEVNIDEILDYLLSKIIKCVTRRKRELKSKVTHLKESALAKTKLARTKIEAQLTLEAAAAAHRESANSAENLTNESRMIVSPLSSCHLNSFTEAPRKEQFGGIWTMFDVKLAEGEIETAINSCGSVHSDSPYSISHVLQIPAGLRIFACSTVEGYPLIETNAERRKLRLSYRQHVPESLGQPVDESAALDFQLLHHEAQPICYVSSIESDQVYELYISYQDEGSSEWSPWSYPFLASTALQSFSWDPSSDDWHVSPDMREATKRINSVTPLFLSAPQFFPGCKICIEVQKRDVTKYPEEGLALVQPWVQFSSLCQQGTLFLNLAGQLFLDGNFVHSFPSQDSNRITLMLESSSQVQATPQGMRVGFFIFYESAKFFVEWNLRGQEGCNYIGIQLNNQGSCAKIKS